jgi:hypothetical protein
MESREQKPEDGAITTELSTYYYLRGHDHWTKYVLLPSEPQDGAMTTELKYLLLYWTKLSTNYYLWTKR